MGSISEAPLVEIPIIDISGYLAGDPEAKRKAASEFRSACENQGFLQVVGHSVPTDVQERFLSAIARFFALPLSEKQKVSQEKSKCYRGYERIGGQKLDELDTSATPDQKEGFSVRPERALGRFLQGPNQWPENLPGFKEAYMEYFNSVHQLSRSVFRLMALSLDLPEDHFDAFASDPDGKPRPSTFDLMVLEASSTHPMLLTLHGYKDYAYVDLTIILLHLRTWRAGPEESALTPTSVP